MNILERAIELVRLDRAMTEREIEEICQQDESATFNGLAFARLLAATIQGFTASNLPVTRQVEVTPDGGRVHTVNMRDTMETSEG
jgi:hypothetical protein